MTYFYAAKKFPLFPLSSPPSLFPLDFFILFPIFFYSVSFASYLALFFLANSFSLHIFFLLFPLSLSLSFPKSLFTSYYFAPIMSDTLLGISLFFLFLISLILGIFPFLSNPSSVLPLFQYLLSFLL